MDKITWGELLDLSGDDPFRRVIDSINELISVSNKMVTSLKSNNQAIAGELNNIQTEAKELATTFSKASVESKEFAGVMQATSKRSAELSGSMIALNKTEADNIATIDRLTKQVQKLEAAQKSAEKATNDQVGSVNDLRKKLTEAENAYRALGDASDQAIKDEHLKKVNDLARQFNSANKILQEAKKGTNAVKGSYDELSQRIANAKKELKALDDGFDKHSIKANALKKEIKEGSDKLKEFDKSIGDTQRSVGDYGIAIQALDQNTGGLVTGLKNMKDALIAAFSNPYVLAATALVGAFIALKEAANQYYETSISGEEALSKQKLIDEIITSRARKQFEDQTKNAAEQAEKLQDIWRKTKQVMLGIVSNNPALVFGGFDKINKAQEAADDLQKKIDANRRDHIRDVVDDANTEILVNRELAKSVDKLHESDEDRLAAIREAGRLQEEQLKGDLDLAQNDLKIQRDLIKAMGGRLQEGKLLKDYTDQEITDIGVKGEHIEKLMQLEKALLDTEAKGEAQRKMINKREAGVAEEIYNSKKDRMKREAEANDVLQKVLIQAEVDAQDEILKSEQATVEEKIIAADNLNKEKARIREIDKQAEIRAAEEAAVARIHAEGKDVDTELAKDEALRVQKLAINTKYNNLEENEAQNTADQIAKLTFDDFLKEQEKAQGLSLEQQFQFLQQRLQMAKLAKQDEDKIMQQMAQIRFAQEQQYEKILVDLRNQSINSSLEIIKNGFQREFEMLEARRNRLETLMAQELELAGDNADAKARIENSYAAKIQEIQNQERENKRKQAIADKAFAAFQIILNTSIAVTKALAELGPFGVPASVALGAIGALQLATVLSRPIPQFAEGTDYSPEGIAIVAEKGPELAVDRRGKATLYDTEGATLTYLERGTKVYDAEDTERIMQGQEFDRVTSTFAESKKVGRRGSSDGSAKLAKALSGKMDDLIYEVRNFEAVKVNITRKGVETMAKKAESIKNYLDKFYR